WEKNVTRLAVVQQLRVYGIKVKNWNAKAGSKGKETNCTIFKGKKLFGAPLHTLKCSAHTCGSIPSFLVDACEHLEKHIHTEGLFRKSGSVVRLKALKKFVKLKTNNFCISCAGGLIAAFWRMSISILFLSEISTFLLRADQRGGKKTISGNVVALAPLSKKKQKTLKDVFLFCVSILFRSQDNKMDSSNLAVIFAPNFLHLSDANEKLTSNTEKRLRLQAAVVQTFIDHAQDVGHVPEFVLEKIPSMMGVDAGCSTPLSESLEKECESSEGLKRRRRRSVGDIVSGALNKLKSNRTPSTTPQPDRSVFSSVTPMVLTPSSKRKLPTESSQGFSSKKRKSLRHNLAFELLPSSFFSSGSSPASGVHIVEGGVSGSEKQHSLKPVEHGLNSANRRKSKRIENRVHRVDSGKAGCFSPSINRKGAARKSLRLRLSLGRSNKDPTMVTAGFSAAQGRYNIGWRLANQMELENSTGSIKENSPFSPVMRKKDQRKGSKYISKSEENLLSPKSDAFSNDRLSWNGASPVELQEVNDVDVGPLIGGYLQTKSSFSEPVLVDRKPPVIPDDLKIYKVNGNSYLCDNSLSGDEKNLTGETLQMIKKAFSESGSNLRSLIGNNRSLVLDDTSVTEESCLLQNVNQNIGLNICSPRKDRLTDLECASSEFSEHKDTLCDHDDTQIIANTCSETEDTESNTDVQKENISSLGAAEIQVSKEDFTEQSVSKLTEISQQISSGQQEGAKSAHSIEIVSADWRLCQGFKENGNKEDVSCIQVNSHGPAEKDVCNIETKSKCVSKKYIILEGCKDAKVAEHIQRFNQLSLNDQGQQNKIKSPPKFRRTPVRQSVRRINSLLDSKQETRNRKLIKSPSLDSPLVKSVSYESSLSYCAEHYPMDCVPSVPCSKAEEQKGLKSQSGYTSKELCWPETLNPTKLSNTSSAENRSHQKALKQRANLGISKHLVFEDLTNQLLPTSKRNVVLSKSRNKSILRHVSEREKVQYKGSPKNPIATKVVVATETIDL
uniref:Rho GTPase activating protein 11A n=1 Tax=Latimeria chalumnae TaxID=7897 RepID=H3AFX1_LATCH